SRSPNLRHGGSMEDTVHLTHGASACAPTILEQLWRPLPPDLLELALREHTREGALVLDPFARGDALARLTSRARRRAVLASVNPLAAFALRTSLAPLPAREFHRAFTWIGNALTHQTLLRIYVDELYATTCPRCGQPAIARFFLWRRDRERP